MFPLSPLPVSYYLLSHLVSSVLYFCLHLDFSVLHLQVSQTVMYAQLALTEPSRKRVVYRSPVDIWIWLAFHFLETWNFNSSGPSEVRLSRFDHRAGPLKENVPSCSSSVVLEYIKLYPKVWLQSHVQRLSQLLTPFVFKNFLSSVVPKYYSTPQFYGNDNNAVVKLHKGMYRRIYLKLRQTSSCCTSRPRAVQLRPVNFTHSKWNGGFYWPKRVNHVIESSKGKFLKDEISRLE